MRVVTANLQIVTVYFHSIDKESKNVQDNAATVRYILNGAYSGP